MRPPLITTITVSFISARESTHEAIRFCGRCLALFFPAVLHAQEPTITIEPEDRCSPYIRGNYNYPQSVEDAIIARMGGRIYSPYTGESFSSKRETDIEHIVAVSEAHDSGLCAAGAATRRAFARDLENLTLASPALNRYQKVAKDVAEWLPAQNQCWFVARVVAIKKKYGLSMDAREAAAPLNVLADCVDLEMKFVAPVTPTATSAPTRAQRQTSGASFTVNRDAVNVRSGPGTNYGKIGHVERGQEFRPNGRNQAGTWLRFPWRGSHGWVAAWLMIVQNADSIPVVAAPALQTQAPPTSTPVSAPTLAPTNTPHRHIHQHQNEMLNTTRICAEWVKEAGLRLPLLENADFRCRYAGRPIRDCMMQCTTEMGTGV